jgi:hypothetical protein
MLVRYQGHVIHAVWQAKRRGEMLHVCEVARSIAETSGSPHLLDAIADALVQEGIRQQATLDMNHPSPSQTRKPN